MPAVLIFIQSVNIHISEMLLFESLAGHRVSTRPALVRLTSCLQTVGHFKADILIERPCTSHLSLNKRTWPQSSCPHHDKTPLGKKPKFYDEHLFTYCAKKESFPVPTKPTFSGKAFSANAYTIPFCECLYASRASCLHFKKTKNYAGYWQGLCSALKQAFAPRGLSFA